jgi:hypothetical protein
VILHGDLLASKRLARECGQASSPSLLEIELQGRQLAIGEGLLLLVRGGQRLGLFSPPRGHWYSVIEGA